MVSQLPFGHVTSHAHAFVQVMVPHAPAPLHEIRHCDPVAQSEAICALVLGGALLMSFWRPLSLDHSARPITNTSPPPAARPKPSLRSELEKNVSCGAEPEPEPASVAEPEPEPEPEPESDADSEADPDSAADPEADPDPAPE